MLIALYYYSGSCIFLLLLRVDDQVQCKPLGNFEEDPRGGNFLAFTGGFFLCFFFFMIFLGGEGDTMLVALANTSRLAISCAGAFGGTSAMKY